MGWLVSGGHRPPLQTKTRPPAARQVISWRGCGKASLPAGARTRRVFRRRFFFPTGRRAFAAGRVWRKFDWTGGGNPAPDARRPPAAGPGEPGTNRGRRPGPGIIARCVGSGRRPSWGQAVQSRPGRDPKSWLACAIRAGVPAPVFGGPPSAPPGPVCKCASAPPPDAPGVASCKGSAAKVSREAESICRTARRKAGIFRRKASSRRRRLRSVFWAVGPVAAPSLPRVCNCTWTSRKGEILRPAAASRRFSWRNTFLGKATRSERSRERSRLSDLRVLCMAWARSGRRNSARASAISSAAIRPRASDSASFFFDAVAHSGSPKALSYPFVETKSRLGYVRVTERAGGFADCGLPIADCELRIGSKGTPRGHPQPEELNCGFTPIATDKERSSSGLTFKPLNGRIGTWQPSSRRCMST